MVREPPSAANSSIFLPEAKNYLSFFFLTCIAVSLFYLIILALYKLCFLSSQSNGSPRNGIHGSRKKEEDIEFLNAAVRKFMVKEYKKESDEEGGVCEICLDEFDEDVVVKLLPRCGHMYHVDCIDRWLMESVSCPHCRTSVVDFDKRGG